MNKHTPGPWVIKDGLTDFSVKAELDPGKWYDIALIHTTTVSIEDQDNACEANARLISCAPDMLKLLEDLHAWLSVAGVAKQHQETIERQLNKVRGVK